MGLMSGLVTSMGDAINWERFQVLRIRPKNPESATDVEIGPEDGWAFFDLAQNYRAQMDSENILIHGTSQSSVWSILGGMQVTASTASKESVGVWTSLNTWARFRGLARVEERQERGTAGVPEREIGDLWYLHQARATCGGFPPCGIV